jgi:hypothetical protein
MKFMSHIAGRAGIRGNGLHGASAMVRVARRAQVGRNHE